MRTLGEFASALECPKVENKTILITPTNNFTMVRIKHSLY